MDDSESLSDLELDVPPKLSFDEAKSQIFREPKLLKQRKELLKTMYYYCKDSKKHSRIIKVLFWPMIVSFIQDKNNNKIALFGLRLLNALIQNEGTHEEILRAGKPIKINENYQNIEQLLEDAKIATKEEFQMDRQVYIDRMKEIIKNNQNPVKILYKKILSTDSTLIMNEATKALRILSKTEEVINILQKENALLSIIRTKFLDSDPLSQEYILETISTACKYPDYRKEFVSHDDIIEIMMSQIKSISPKVTYQTLKILRQLAKDQSNLEKLQGLKLRLSHKLIYAFKWLDSKNQQESNNANGQMQADQVSLHQNKNDSQSKGLIQEQTGQPIPSELDMIYREISKTFQYILKYYDIHQKLLNNNAQKEGEGGQIENHGSAFTENDIIDTIINLGRATSDPKTTLNAATSLAHITEILHCNESVASQDAIEFMMDMLKDTKNIKHHRQGCRYFANLSFYSNHRNSLVQNKITAYLLGAIEVDGLLDEDTIKHSAIALANLSSHKDFMTQAQKASKGDLAQISKVDRGKIKPLIHLLDSAKEGKINLIQSACITLCNMASKPSLHQHFVQEPEISTIKNCLQNPIDKDTGNELTRFMIKLVCNLTKNPEILPHLSKKGFLEILFDLLNHETEKEIFGNVVTAISYLSVQKECQEKIIRNDIISKILRPLNELHEVDKKLIMIAITSMLFNGIELQKEFIRNKGLDALLHFMGQKEKLFQQLSCKCFSLLSENHENLQEILNYECLNNIIIQCLKNKDIDLETLKEITKIFINLILWRKLKKDTIQTTCYLCDIGLMINDIDMNILAIFCLNALSENEHSHEFIIKTCIDEGGNPADDINQQSSIFSRLNYLLDLYDVKPDSPKIDAFKKELLVQLITSFYLNLARNEQNCEFLLSLKIFQKLNNLMQKHMIVTLAKGQENSALCYTNTIFAKLLKHEQSKKQCIEEEGYKLFISILQNKGNQHLYLETLDSIKLFLTKREYLKKFHEIPKCIELTPLCHELNVSFLQVLAILSFEKENHQALKDINFLEKLEERGMFTTLFDHFEELMGPPQQALDQRLMVSTGGNKRTLRKSVLDSDNTPLLPIDRKAKKSKAEKERSNELALAIAIILANLSSEEDFVRSLLGVNKWKNKDKKLQQSEQTSHNQFAIFQARGRIDSHVYNSLKEESKLGDDEDIMINHSQNDPELMHMGEDYDNISQPTVEDYDEVKIRDLPEVKRIANLFNLLAHENSFIAEQIAILLANVSNSPYFRHFFISDRSMKALIKILRFDRKQKPTEVTLLAVLIGVLNLSSLKEIVQGIENLRFPQCLEDIIKNEQLPFVTKSIGLLAVSNLFTLSKTNQISNETKDFAFDVLEHWKSIYEDQHENIEVVKNMVYSSLILFYNLILRKANKDLTKKLINILTEHILDFNDNQIVSIVLELITLFTREKETAQLIFKNQALLVYTFEKLKLQDKDPLKLSSLALSRLAARLDEYNSELFIQNLKDFQDFGLVVENINQYSTDEGIMNQILKYFLNFLENVSSFKKTRDELQCSKLYDASIQLFTDKISLTNKISLINIIFNLNFNLREPRELNKEFLKQLYRTYKDEALKKDEKIQRKLIALLVSATAKEENHKGIIKCGFYTQFKRNINELYDKLMEANEEVELFGLVNIALNKKYMHLIYQDLKKIYKIALRNDKIDYKTKVDLFTECSKFLAKLSSNQGGNAIALNEKVGSTEKDISEMIDHCLKALLFCLIQLIQLLDQSQYPMFKYLLTAILDSTKNLKNHLIILIKIDHLLDFLQSILLKDFEFQMKDFDDQVLNFSLRVIVCEIFFNLKVERGFFKRDNITECIKLLVQYAQKVIGMNIDKKMTIISNTLRLLSQMIASVHSQADAHEKILRTNSVDLVKEAMALSKDLQPCVINCKQLLQINIDALFCLTNMMNVKELALDPSLLSQETVNNALLIYFAYNHQVELDECIITFLYSISKYPEYQHFMKDKSKVLFFLMDKHLDASKEGYKESCRKKIFSTVHNMTEDEEICKQLNIAKFIQLTNKMLAQTSQNLYSSDHIHELALKSLINMCRNSNEGLEEANLKDLFSGISSLYAKFKSLAKQYSLRLITILTKQWNAQKIEEYLDQIIEIISQFIERCDSIIEMKLALLNLERISFFKKLMQKLADNQCAILIKNIGNFMQKSITKEDYQNSIDQLIKFCKKLSKQNKSHEHLVNHKIHEVALDYISRSQIMKLGEYQEKQLKMYLTTIQNVMKMIKNIYEGGCINEEQRIDIYTKVNSKEEVISIVDSLLTAHQNNDELAIMIVNIIICFNSIQNKLDGNRVKTWITSFSQRLLESSIKTEFQKQRSWYMEKYVFIIELLVTKNIDKIDKEITDDILKILEIDQANFTKTLWFKVLKILAHLQYLQDISSQQTLESIFKFIIKAYEKANENLCFYYFMRVVIMLVKKVDNAQLFKSSKEYQAIFQLCVTFLKNNFKERVDPLVMEILLYMIDFFKFLINFQQLHLNINQNEIVFYFIEMVSIHDNPYLLKALTGAIVEASKITVFYPDLLNDHSLNIIFTKILNTSNMEPKTFENLYDCLKNILIQTKVPVKYLIATTVLRISETKNSWKEKEESSIITLLKVLQFVMKSLEEQKPSTNEAQVVQSEHAETFVEMTKKTKKYCLIAITNILIKSNPEYIFNRRVNLTQILIDYSSFDDDQQMNLRFMYLLYLSLDKNTAKDLQSATLMNLITFLLTNVHKFKNVLLMKESYFFEIPNSSKLNPLPPIQVHSASQGSSKPRETTTGQITVAMLDSQIKINSPHHHSSQQLVDNSGGNTLSPIQAHYSQNIDSFFFEAEEVSLRKIDGIRLSLCLTIKIIYKITTAKKKAWCQSLLDNDMFNDIYKYLNGYIEQGDLNTLKQVLQIVKMTKNCSEFLQLHSLLLNSECVPYLIKVLEKSIQYQQPTPQVDNSANEGEDFSQAFQVKMATVDPEQIFQMRRKHILIPILRTFTLFCQSQDFNWDKHNIQDLLNRIKATNGGKNEDTQISEILKELSEKLQEHSGDSALLNSNHEHHEYVVELESILKDSNEARQLKQLNQIEQDLNKQKSKVERISNIEIDLLYKILALKKTQQEVSNECIQIKKVVIAIIALVYQNKFVKENQTLQLEKRKTGNSNVEEQLKELGLGCVVEKGDSFQLLGILAAQQRFVEMHEKMAEIIDSYSQCNYIKQVTLLEHVLPLSLSIMSPPHVSLTTITHVLEALVRLLKHQEQSQWILKANKFDVALILNQVIKNEAHIFANETLFTNLELIVKLIYYQPVRVTPSSLLFIRILIDHHTSIEFNRLGLFSLYCISLALQESQYSQNLFIFQNEQILQGIFSRVKGANHTHPHSQIHNQPIDIAVSAKLRLVALQTLVNVLEFINLNPNEEENRKVMHKVFIEFDLLTILIHICEAQSENSIEENKLAARAFAALPTLFLVKKNPYVDLNLKEHSEFTIMGYFNAITNIVRQSDPEAAYFAFYALLNFIHIVEINEEHHNPHTKDGINKIRLMQMDYQTLCAALIKSQLLHSILIMPQTTTDQDIIRVCLKLLISIMFKGTYSRIVFLESNESPQQMQNQARGGIQQENKGYFTQAVRQHLGIEIEQERDRSKDQLNSLLEKMQTFELTQIHLGGYVQFLHLLSQLILSSGQHYTSNHSINQYGSHYLPPSSILVEILRKASQTIVDPEFLKILTSSKQDPEQKQLVLYKYFFYTYLLSVTLPQLLDHCFSTNLNSHQDQSQGINTHDTPGLVFKALSLMLETLKDSQLNEHLDQLMANAHQSEEENKEQEEEEESPSTTMSIIRLALFNIETIVRITHQKSQGSDYLQLNGNLNETLMTLLNDHEENGDIVESIYQILHQFLDVTNGNSEHHNVKLMEKSKVLLSHSIKHASVYQCEQAYVFVKDLVQTSAKYTNKPEIERALQQIRPPQQISLQQH